MATPNGSGQDFSVESACEKEENNIVLDLKKRYQNFQSHPVAGVTGGGDGEGKTSSEPSLMRCSLCGHAVGVCREFNAQIYCEPCFVSLRKSLINEDPIEALKEINENFFKVR